MQYLAPRIYEGGAPQGRGESAYLLCKRKFFYFNVYACFGKGFHFLISLNAGIKQGKSNCCPFACTASNVQA